MNNTLALIKKHGLIANNVSYSEIANAFLTTGYTSHAGNTYYNSIWVAEGILIKESLGQGWYYTFLNGIKIYSIKDKTLIADKSFHNLCYSKGTVTRHAKTMLLKVLKEAATSEGSNLNEKQASKIIDQLLQKAINEDQREFIQKQTQKYLAA